MSTIITTAYTFDPEKSILTIFRNGKPIGGFRGEIGVKFFYEMLDSGADISIIGNMDKSQKIQRLRALWIKQGIDQYRDAILNRYGVTSTKDLTEPQLDSLIREFTHTYKMDVPKEIREWRSNILKLLQELGVYDNSGAWDRVNVFMMQPRIAGKLLYQMNLAELKALSQKLHSIIKKNDDRINLAQLN